MIIAIIAFAAVAAVIWYFAVFATKSEPVQTIQDSTANIAEKENLENDNPYANLKGDAFDEAYLADMIAHHDGAVNMSEQAQAFTAREEIRTLAGDITMSQSQELIKMRDWQVEWGYEVTMSGGHMSHGGAGMDMGGDMVEMMNKLNDLRGEEYDKEFLRQMIIHHEQAVEMSQYAEVNAKHQEIKDLANDVITTQTKEIELMKQWQEVWGY